MKTESQPGAPLDSAQFEGLLTCDGIGKEAKRVILGQLLSELQQLRTQRDALAGALRDGLEYLESPPFLALHGDMPAKRSRKAIASLEGGQG